MSNYVLCIMGATATGKTDLAIRLAETLPAELINVDSALIYRNMNIGTAKPDTATLAKFPHHLIDILDPSESYSVAEFCEDASREIENSFQQNRCPILVGGTMLYFNALQKGISDLPSADDTTRAQLAREAKKIGWPAMHKRLQSIDPQAADRIKATDPQRISRALEVYELTGKPMSELWKAQAKPSHHYQFINIALTTSDRPRLHQRIETRFDQMLANGFVDEVMALYQRGDLTLDHPSMRCVGYRQVWEYLAGELDYDSMREKAIIKTRQMAKRQMTWLRGMEDIIEIDCFSDNIAEQVVKHLPD